MSAIDDPKTLGRGRLSFADQHDIDEFIATLEKFERGEVGPDQWRAFRLVRGTDDVHMLRVKVPQGVLDARQLYAFATVAQTLLARLWPHHHAPERPIPLREAPRCPAGDAAPRRRRSSGVSSCPA